MTFSSIFAAGCGSRVLACQLHELKLELLLPAEADEIPGSRSAIRITMPGVDATPHIVGKYGPPRVGARGTLHSSWLTTEGFRDDIAAAG